MRQLLLILFACSCLGFQFQSNDNYSSPSFYEELPADTPRLNEIVMGGIAGEAMGPAKGLANLFRISLYGPDSKKKFICSKPFNWEGEYTFESLPEGKYWVTIENNSNTPVKVSPKRRILEIRNGKVQKVNFVFK